MNKGFTLVELLAVLIILAVISLIVMVSVGDTISNSKNSLSDVQKKRIEEAAEIYYNREGMNIDADCVNVSDLIEDGYIQGDAVLDPKNKNQMVGSVSITYASNQYVFEYQEQACPPDEDDE